jgi:hypothetical protein
VDFPPGVGKFGEGVEANDSDTYDKETYLSEHNLSKSLVTLLPSLSTVSTSHVALS